MICPQCAALLDDSALSCIACQSLVHADRLEQLAAEAKAATDRGDPAAAREHWTQALTLLPPESKQYQGVAARIADLDRIIPAPDAPHQTGDKAKWAAKFGPIGLLLWKFKTVGLLLLTKGKLILLGLTKLSTLTTMLGAMGLYWALYGWKFGVGLVLAIYIHEMGHVWELRRFGIAASAPVFIPGFGALVMLKQRPPTVGQDARVGLAGPIWGMATACVTLALFYATNAPIWAALTRFGAWINLFNLIPVWQLDGGRGFAALTRRDRGIVLGLAVTMWVLTNDGVLFLVALGAAYRMFTKDAALASDPPILRRFAVLLVVLAILCLTGLPAGAPGGVLPIPRP